MKKRVSVRELKEYCSRNKPQQVLFCTENVDFSDAAVDFMSGRTYVIKGRVKLEHKQNRIEKDYMEDYQRWKLAFLM